MWLSDNMFRYLPPAYDECKARQVKESFTAASALPHYLTPIVSTYLDISTGPVGYQGF